ncbi:hypothetical protein V6N12_028958 [Hibiscus sabdariffa]|uniref:Uncharacterized protein n=1 Tax=Hibiscus sabdariffa TaxID=183260 RepID=A0ABR2F7G6_9ROSI
MVVCILCVVHVEGPVGAALRPGAIRGGASFVWLASCPRDSLGSPRLEAELPPLRLGFHSAMCGACSLLRSPCTPGALALSVTPTMGALDAALDAALALSCAPSMGALDVALDAALAPQQLRCLFAQGALLPRPGCLLPRLAVHFLRPFRGLCVTLWRGVQVTLGPVTMGHCLVLQASSVWTL